MFNFTIDRLWNNRPIKITVHDWTVAQALKKCSEKELSEFLSNKMIIG